MFYVRSVEILSQVLNSLPHLSILNVSYCKLNATGIEMLLKSIKKISIHFVELDISGNDCGEQGTIGFYLILKLMTLFFSIM